VAISLRARPGPRLKKALTPASTQPARQTPTARYGEICLISASGGMVAGVPTYAEERILKAGCIATGEELLGIGRIISSAKQRKLEVEQTVIAADRTVTASARRDFCGI
jgi:hypothetical protein